MEIRVEHAARGKTFDHTQLLNSKQDQRRPDVIEKLHSDEQNPERNFVSLSLGCESDAVMSNKHLSTNHKAFVAASGCLVFRGSFPPPSSAQARALTQPLCGRL